MAKNSWKFVYILAKQYRSHFNLTNFFDKKFQTSNFAQFFVQKFNFNFPRKLSIFLGWKTRENVLVLDFLAVDNFDFTRKIVKTEFLDKNLTFGTVCFYLKRLLDAKPSDIPSYPLQHVWNWHKLVPNCRKCKSLSIWEIARRTPNRWQCLQCLLWWLKLPDLRNPQRCNEDEFWRWIFSADPSHLLWLPFQIRSRRFCVWEGVQVWQMWILHLKHKNGRWKNWKLE